MKEIKDSMNTITQGVYIIGTKGYEKNNSMTAAWVTQISSHPNRILIAVAKTHYSAELIKESGCFSISVLNDHNRELAVRCGFVSGRNTDKLVGLEVEYAITGAPLIKDVKAHMDCKLSESIEVGDHILFIGEVVYGKVFDGSPMVYHSEDFFN